MIEKLKGMVFLLDGGTRLPNYATTWAIWNNKSHFCSWLNIITFFSMNLPNQKKNVISIRFFFFFIDR